MLFYGKASPTLLRIDPFSCQGQLYHMGHLSRAWGTHVQSGIKIFQLVEHLEIYSSPCQPSCAAMKIIIILILPCMAFCIPTERYRVHSLDIRWPIFVLFLLNTKVLYRTATAWSRRHKSWQTSFRFGRDKWMGSARRSGPGCMCRNISFEGVFTSHCY